MTATKNPASGPQSVKVSYRGNPGVTAFYAAYDMAGNVITARTSVGVTESIVVGGLYTYDQSVSIDEFIVEWDENDGVPAAVEMISTRHPVTLPSKPTSVTATAGDTQATVAFIAGASGGSAITGFTVTASPGGQVQSALASPIIVTGLTNGTAYTFTVVQHTGAGDSPASNPSNSVSPTATLHVPGAPTGIVATAGNGQATIAFTAPANNGGSAITGYTVTAVDETSSGRGGQTNSGASSPRTVTGLTNGDLYHFTVHATNAIGNSVESVASNTVTPIGSGTAIATFTATTSAPTLLHVDATNSSGTLRWTIDGVDAVSTATIVTFGPLKVGSHTVLLTATAGSQVSSQTTIDVPWIGWPFTAETDPANSPAAGVPGTWGLPLVTSPTTGKLVGSNSTTLLPAWSTLDPQGPYKTQDVLNMAEGYPGAGDGVPRLTILSSSEIEILTKMPDRPGDAGGYRGAFDWNNAYGTVGGVAVDFGPGNEFQANSQYGRIDACGMAPGDGSSTQVRFYRVGIKIPGTNPFGPSDTNTYGGGFTNTGLLYQNNMFELHGNAGGNAPMCFNTDGAGKQCGWTFTQSQGGTQIGGLHRFDFANIQYDTYYNYIVEIVWNLNPTIGYMRVYRDYEDGAGYVLIPIARTPAGTKGKAPDTTPSSDPDYGKFFAATQQTDATGKVVLVAFDLENYRNKATLDPYWQTYGIPYPDVRIRFRKPAIGSTLASVSAL